MWLSLGWNYRCAGCELVQGQRLGGYGKSIPVGESFHLVNDCVVNSDAGKGQYWWSAHETCQQEGQKGTTTGNKDFARLRAALLTEHSSRVWLSMTGTVPITSSVTLWILTVLLFRGCLRRSRQHVHNGSSTVRPRARKGEIFSLALFDVIVYFFHSFSGI